MKVIEGSNLYQCQKCFALEACYRLVPTKCRCGGDVEVVAIGESIEVEISPRKAFSAKQRETVWNRDMGICCICGFQIQKHERWEMAHEIHRGIGGTNDLENVHPAHYACHRHETNTKDITTVAKSNRIVQKRLGFKKTSRPIPGSKASGVKISMSGKVTKR